MNFSPLMPVLVNGEVIFADFINRKVYLASIENNSIVWIERDNNELFGAIDNHRESLTPELPHEILEDAIHTKRKLQGKKPPIKEQE